VKYAFVTQRGYYPEALDKANQDAVLVKKDFGGTAGQMFFGVFDGHGIRGEEAAQFAKAKVTHSTAPRHTTHWKRPRQSTTGRLRRPRGRGFKEEQLVKFSEGDVSVAHVVQCIYSSA